MRHVIPPSAPGEEALGEPLRRQCDQVGWAILGYLALTFLSLLLFPPAGNRSAARELFSTLLSAGCLLLPYWLLGRRAPLPLGKPRPGATVPTLLAGMAVASLGSLLSSLLQLVMGRAGWELEEVQPSFSQNPLLNLVILLGMTLCAALAEEIAFRGFLLGFLRRWGDGFAIVLSAVVFAFSHSTLLQALPAFLSGLAFGYFTLVSRSLWPSVAAHLCYNGLAIAVNQLSQALGGRAGTVFGLLWALLLLAGGGVSLALCRRRRLAVSLSRGAPPLSPREKTGAVLASPVLMMAFLCLLVNLAGSVS